MDVIESTLDMDSDDANSNAEFIVNAVDDLRTIQQKVIDKSYSAKPKFDKRGQILPHERLQLLLDLDSPFVELCGLAGYKQHDDKDGTDAGGGILSGIGYVSGVRCLVTANNSAIKGGLSLLQGLKKRCGYKRLPYKTVCQLFRCQKVAVLILIMPVKYL